MVDCLLLSTRKFLDKVKIEALDVKTKALDDKTKALDDKTKALDDKTTTLFYLFVGVLVRFVS